MPLFRKDITFVYRDTLNKGAEDTDLPVAFLHGIGGSMSQPTALLDPLPPGIRLISMDCRGHGLTIPLGAPEKLSFDSLADDLISLLDELEIPQALIGGISMGAGVALNLALRYPDRVLGLILSRPAWLDGPMAACEVYLQIASLIHRYGPEEGRQRFESTKTYRLLLGSSPDAARSLLGQFDEARAVDALERLEYLPQDRPIPALQALVAVRVPTLVLATKLDPIHPLLYGKKLARSIPGAKFQEVTAKSLSQEQHRREMHRCMFDFLSMQRQRRWRDD